MRFYCLKFILPLGSLFVLFFASCQHFDWFVEKKKNATKNINAFLLFFFKPNFFILIFLTFFFVYFACGLLCWARLIALSAQCLAQLSSWRSRKSDEATNTLAHTHTHLCMLVCAFLLKNYSQMRCLSVGQEMQSNEWFKLTNLFLRAFSS